MLRGSSTVTPTFLGRPNRSHPAIQPRHALTLGAGLLLLAMLTYSPAAQACRGTSSSATTPCIVSMVMAKKSHGVVVIPGAGGPITITGMVTLTCRSAPGATCDVSTISWSGITASATATKLAPPPAVPLIGATFSGSDSLAGVCGDDLDFSITTTPLLAGGGGFFSIVGTTDATVTFTAQTPATVPVVAGGDMVVCLVEEAPGSPGVPRLDMQLIGGGGVGFSQAGGQRISSYLLTNNDPTESVTLTLTADSTQIAGLPSDPSALFCDDLTPCNVPADCTGIGDQLCDAVSERDGVYAISTSGDDFPIAFVNSATPPQDASECLPLPDHPYFQPEITKAVSIPAGGSTTVHVATRSWGQCADGSCSEATVVATGQFSGGDDVVACAGVALFVDTALPADVCAEEVFDCNGNGIADAVDIQNGTSLDLNANAIPDECELVVSVPALSYRGLALLAALFAAAGVLTAWRYRVTRA